MRERQAERGGNAIPPALITRDAGVVQAVWPLTRDQRSQDAMMTQALYP
jgi:hypothetical protein